MAVVISALQRLFSPSEYLQVSFAQGDSWNLFFFAGDFTTPPPSSVKLPTGTPGLINVSMNLEVKP